LNGNAIALSPEAVSTGGYMLGRLQTLDVGRGAEFKHCFTDGRRALGRRQVLVEPSLHMFSFVAQLQSAGDAQQLGQRA
jgi:hypothetical protein